MKKNKGFTLIELLVVIAIIAILSTVVMAGLNSARAKGRDAKRISDVKALQTAFELYYDSCGRYPAAMTTASNTGCTGGESLGTYMNPMPTAPTPEAAPAGYVYASADGTTYSVVFGLEGKTGALGSGSHTATPAGIT